MSTEILTTLVETPSVFPNETAISGKIRDMLVGYGFTVKEIPVEPGRNNIVGTFGESDQYLGFYGHMDTVPPHPDYQQDPYTLKIEGDRATGLGVIDMKGGVAAILEAAKFAAENKLPVKVLFGVDEENISKGAHALVDAGELDDVAFLVVGESGQVDDYDQPFAVNYGRKGHLQFNIHVKGRAVHAAESHKGVNAIDQAAKVITGMSSIHLGDHPELGTSNIVLRAIHSDTSSLSVPDSCDIRVSVLTSPGVKGSDFVDKVQEVSEQLGIPVDVSLIPRESPYNEAYEVDRNNPFLQLLEQKLSLLDRVKIMYSNSVADENVFANGRRGLPVISLGPIGAGDHTEYEWLSMRSYEETRKVYEEIIKLFAEFGNQQK